jgi:hypothetical protein
MLHKHNRDFTDADYIVSNEVNIRALFSGADSSWGLNFDARRFVTDVIFRHVNSNVILVCMDKLHLLYTTRGGHTMLNKGEFSFLDVLTDEEMRQCDFGAIVFGWCLLDRSDEDVVAVELFESLVPGRNLGALMLLKIRQRFNKCVLPRQPIHSAVDYWQRQCEDDFSAVHDVRGDIYFDKELQWPKHMIRAMREE